MVYCYNIFNFSQLDSNQFKSILLQLKKNEWNAAAAEVRHHFSLIPQLKERNAAALFHSLNSLHLFNSFKLKLINSLNGCRSFSFFLLCLRVQTDTEVWTQPELNSFKKLNLIWLKLYKPDWVKELGAVWANSVSFAVISRQERENEWPLR